MNDKFDMFLKIFFSVVALLGIVSFIIFLIGLQEVLNLSKGAMGLIGICIAIFLTFLGFFLKEYSMFL